MNDPVQYLKKVLRALQVEERKQAKRRTRKADWDAPGVKVEYVRDLKRKRRADALPKDRVCPQCDELKTRSRQWCVFDGKREPMCRACAIAQGLFYGRKT